MMHKRQITLKDGRYMIFYTFDEDEAGDTGQREQAAPPPPPDPVIESEDERNV
jgi:predicted lipoprotein with Yx(FWY)xxD motif